MLYDLDFPVIEQKLKAIGLGSGPYFGMGKHMSGDVKSQGRQDISVKLILTMMYLIKKIKKTIKKEHVLLCYNL
jgi:hypothetical protein